MPSGSWLWIISVTAGQDYWLLSSLTPLIVSPRTVNASPWRVSFQVISSGESGLFVCGGCMNATMNLAVKSYGGFCVIFPMEDFSFCFVLWPLIERASCPSALWKAWLYCGIFVWSEESLPWEAESFLGFSHGMTVPELFFLAVRRKIIRISHFLKKYILILCGIQFFLKLRVIEKFLFGGRGCLSRTYHLKFKLFVCLC